MNQQGNNMAAMNSVAGVPGNANAMAGMMGKPPNQDPIQMLNTYIYDYLIKNKHFKLAREFQNHIHIFTSPNGPKQNPPQRNGVSDSMDTDSKDESIPDDLPLPMIPTDSNADNSFLFDWWVQFWEVFQAQRNKYNPNNRHAQYLNFSKQNAQMRNERNSQLMNGNFMGRPGMNPRMMMNGKMNPEQLRAFQQVQQKNGMIPNGMVRDGSGMNMGEQRPNSPGNAENGAPSPKRPRIEGNNNFTGQAGPGGRTQPMQGPQMGATSGPGGNQMMMANGMPQGEIPPNPFGGFNGQNGPQKPMEGMGPGGPQQMGGPGGMEGQGDIFAGNAGAGRMPGPGGQPGGQQAPGNHALQDYQMQLMLLEQQNKKRLLMARQEQDNMTQAPHASGVGQPGFGAPAMSPQGSRAGPSPNPSDQIKRGTPKIGGQAGLPGSPMPDGSMAGNRASPIPNVNGGFEVSTMPGVPPQYYPPNGPGMGQGMRPPSSHPNPNFSGAGMSQQQMEAMRRSQQMANGGMWPQQQLMQQNPGQQPHQQPQIGTPQQRNNNMPPPPAPQNGAEQRTQPPSPQQNSNAPPTPNQTNKAAPKKKDKNDNKKKGNAKKNSTAATGATPAASEAEAQTPTPATPITPMNANSFAQKNGQAPNNNQNQAQPNNQAAPPVQQQHMDPNGSAFGMDNDGGMLDFGPLDGGDVLETFDFDSFLHTEDNTGGFGADFNFGFPNDGVEADSMG